MKELKFEEALGRLEQIVRQLENGETTLEESLQLFEAGVKLARVCNQKLDGAEEKIQILLREKDGVVRAPFDIGDDVNES